MKKITFLVVPDNFPIPHDAILGMAYFVPSKSKFDFKTCYFKTEDFVIKLQSVDVSNEICSSSGYNVKSDVKMRYLPTVYVIDLTA